MLTSDTVGPDKVDRISIDIEGLRDSLEAIAAEEERNLNQMIRFLLKQALTNISSRSSQSSRLVKPDWIGELDTSELAALATGIISELEQRAQAAGTDDDKQHVRE